MNPTFAALLRAGYAQGGRLTPRDTPAVRRDVLTPARPPQPILTLPACLDVHSEGPGDLLPNVCARDRGHAGPHCTKGYWHTVGHVTTTTWDDEGTR